MRKSPPLLLFLALLLGACDQASVPTAPEEADAPEIDVSDDALDTEALVVGAEGEPSFREGEAQVVPGRFIVTLRDDAAGAASDVASTHGIQPDHVYTHALNGFAGSISEAARSRLLRDARVLSIEPDRYVYATTTQSNATWGIDRIDQRALPLSNTFTYKNTGNGVTVFIVDTGLRFSHNQFGGRAVRGFDGVGDGRNGADCNGHGTHVAGTVGGAQHGVAKKAKLVSVRVLDCNGSGLWSWTIAGLDYVIAQKNAQPSVPMVVNMSLSGSAFTPADDAVKKTIAAGVIVVVAAGNNGANACNYSPARVGAAITVGATDATDTRAGFSNFGSCVDWFAPGVSITSAWYTSNTALAILNGTSMASPHTAGVAALYLQTRKGASPSAVRKALFNLTTKNIVSNSLSTNRHLLFTNL